MTESARVLEAATYIRGRAPHAPQLAVILGSGLSGFAGTLERAVRLPYAGIPHMAPTGVVGHPGELVIGSMHGAAVLAFCGRFHLYEGRTASEVAFPVRVAARLGAGVLVVTNAAGSINVSHRVGDLMILTDHINLTGANPLAGPADSGLGERFVDMTETYDPELIAVAEKAGGKSGVGVRKGVYLGLAGPSYETPAEIRMARAMGADAVGMSTVMEVIAARQAGLRVLGLSCLTNLAAGVGTTNLDHQAVLAATEKAQEAVSDLLAAIARDVAARRGGGV